MLTLGIRYLTGCVVASDVADRERVEWPPHPGRVFMALAAAHFQTGANGGEQAALEWLEGQGAPGVYASTHSRRAIVTHYVPVNDRAGPSKAAIQSLERLTRSRQPRSFARAWLEDDTVYLFWPDAQPADHLPALEVLCGKVTRIGHSASLVQMWAGETEPLVPPNWLPSETQPEEYMRVPSTGLLRYLQQQFNSKEIDYFFKLKSEAEASDERLRETAKAELQNRFKNQAPVQLRPEISIWSGYTLQRELEPEGSCGTVFSPQLLAFSLRRLDGPYRNLHLAATLQLTARLREALLQHLGTDIPEVLSGHRGNEPSELAHIALLPLAFVGHDHADGGIRGVAVAVPHELGSSDRQRLLRALVGIRRNELKLGPLGRWALDPPDNSSVSLRVRTWTAAIAGARRWATVTPYVFDRHAKAKDKTVYFQELAEAVCESWRRVSRSVNNSVEVTPTPLSAHLGAPSAHEFPRLLRKDGSACRHMHLILEFDQPVVGPVLLGAGRFRGYGLCRPLEQ